jgi:hypothetical protein
MIDIAGLVDGPRPDQLGKRPANPQGVTRQ